MANGTAPAQNIKTFQPGDYLCMQGDVSDDVFVLRSGKVQIFVVDTEGRVTKERVEAEGMLVAEVTEPNSFIGEIGVILKEKRSASIKVVGPASVMVVNLRGQGFESTILGNPKLGLNLARSIAKRLAATSAHITRADELTNRIKAVLDQNTRDYYESIHALLAAFPDPATRPPFLAELEAAMPMQIGKLAARYGTVPTDIYTSIVFPFNMQDHAFHNRIFMSGAQQDTEPAGAPKPGVAVFEPGTRVCAEGSPDPKFYFLLGGKLEVFVGAHPVEIIQGKGAIFGEMALFGDMPRSSGVQALTEVQAMPIPANIIEPYLLQKPPLMLHVLRVFAKRLPRLNETLMMTVQQMGRMMNLLSRDAGGCVSAFETATMHMRENAASIPPELAGNVSRIEADAAAISRDFEQINNDYQQLCTEMGYFPKQTVEQPAVKSLVTQAFKFITKTDDLDTLDCEHVNFILNPKTSVFRGCPIEHSHADLFHQCKIKPESWKDFIVGRIHNYQGTFPSQYITIDRSTIGAYERPTQEITDAMVALAQRVEQEVTLILSDTASLHTIYLPDFMPKEEELVDESTIQGFIDKFKTEPDNREHLDKLNSLYWDLIIATVLKKVPKIKDDMKLPFEDVERDLINFGLIDRKFLGEDSKALAQIDEDRAYNKEGEPMPFLYLEDMLQEIYPEAFGSIKLGKLLDIRKEAETKLQAARDRVAALLQTRTEIISSFPNGGAAAGLVSKMDAVVAPMVVLERKMKMGRQLTPEERTRIVAIKNGRAAMQNQLGGYFTAIKGQADEAHITQFRTMGEELIQRSTDILVLEEDLDRKVVDVKAQEAAIKAITMKQKENTYKNEIMRLKKFILMAAKKSKMDPTAVLVNAQQIATKTRVLEIVNLFLSDKVDPDIFNPSIPRVKKDGVPTLLLMPGSGTAVYDWEKNSFIVPLISPKDLEESIANAFMMFHWDMDEDKTLRQSYGNLKVYRKLSEFKLKEQLAKDYVQWATKESKERKVLAKEVRNWFLIKIAKSGIKQDAAE